SRYFDPYLKLVYNGNLEVPAVAIIDGDSDELDNEEDVTTAISNAKKFEVENRVMVSAGTKTLETDLFPSYAVNTEYLKCCFLNLGHEKSYDNLVEATKGNPELWARELIKRIDNTITKGR